MKFLETNIKGCFVILPEPIEDDRGVFFRSFCKNEFKEYIGELTFIQMNHSINHKEGTFRGMHYQLPPHSEGKLIRCIKGSIVDFFLDIRQGSDTFLKHDKIELSAENRTMVYLCKGVAHGFMTLEDNTELIYQHTESYHKEADRGIRFNDPKVNVELPFEIKIISEKDQNYPLLSNHFKGIDI